MKKYLSKPKIRKPHHQYHPGKQVKADTAPPKINAQRTTGIVTVAVILFALLGAGICFFAADGNIIWVIASAIIGASIGYFFGYQIVKGLSRK